MIEPGKLCHLEGGQKRRKIALTLGALERDVDGIPEKGNEYSYKSISRADYIKEIVKITLKDPDMPEDAAKLLLEVLASEPFDENGVVKQRDFFEGVSVYAEDIRSPFNLGSIFRTAEAMGAESVFVSPLCVPPDHPKAVRSGMGCIETLGWQKKSLDELEKYSKENDIPIFVLETGGTPIEEFNFPKKGICIVGSEELGVSPEALKKAEYGRVSIPMKGLKASLNVGVAFGILMQKWVESLES